MLHSTTVIHPGYRRMGILEMAVSPGEPAVTSGRINNRIDENRGSYAVAAIGARGRGARGSDAVVYLRPRPRMLLRLRRLTDPRSPSRFRMQLRPSPEP
jgi:hypothetical protein